jgi:NADH-quinone oxidoreductase subunit G
VDIDACAAALVRRALEGRTSSPGGVRLPETLPGTLEANPDLEGHIEALAQDLRRSRSPVIVCGTDIVRESTPAIAAGLARLLRETITGTGLFYVLPGPNAFGAGLLSSRKGQPPVGELLASGKIGAVVMVERDLFRMREEIMELVLKRVKHLVVLDYLPSASATRAHVFLPTATLFEGVPATFVNQEGRAQQATPVHRGGTPLSQISGGRHPPRTFLADRPGGDPKAAHHALADLFAAISGEAPEALLKDMHRWLVREDVRFKALLPPSTGCRLMPAEISGLPFSSPQTDGGEGSRKRFEVVLTDRTFGTEELSTYSRVAALGETPPRLFMHPDDATRLGLTAGDEVMLGKDGREVRLILEVATNMAAGTIVAPRHRHIPWQRLRPALEPEDIRKV